MDLEALRLGHLAQLREAVDDWSAMVTKLDSLKADAGDHLASRARKATWSGCNATVTREFIDKTADEIKAPLNISAHEEGHW
ncbi:hypothetical protein C3486_35610 [Streptomyces sp. Ru73]|uniref:hypothetical protein n=1 Tax=Streptomyces sp. Ru73 TaxID=2080748 RepID=UPI000CDD1EEF|nr:hypothetical protein [Streptomyces sp. Ru73]POX36055.1 hypothetical protein C3486_35610 [Streptomyces sp. Ru73]